MYGLPLSQTAEVVEKGVTLMERLIQAGPALIFATFCLILGYVVRHLYRENKDLESSYRTSLEGQIGGAMTSTKLLTETLTTTNATNATVASMLAQVHETMTRTNAKLDQMERRAGS